jgi:hypothetical protein
MRPGISGQMAAFARNLPATPQPKVIENAKSIRRGYARFSDFTQQRCSTKETVGVCANVSLKESSFAARRLDLSELLNEFASDI